MTTTINATWVKSQLNDSGLGTTVAEDLADSAIDLLVTFGAGLSNLTGDAGAKTGSYTSRQTGAIRTLLREAYKRYKHPDGNNMSIQGISISFTDTAILDLAERLAKRLKGSSIGFVVAQDNTGLG